MKKSNTKSKIMMMLRQGVKAKEIAEKLGTSTSYVYVVRNKVKNSDPEVKSKKEDKPISSYEIHLKNSLAQARLDMVNHPPHYTAGGIETIDFIEAKQLGYNLGNVVKYVSRSTLKGDQLENLKKAQWYLNREIKQLETKVSK
jgi:transposase